MNFEPLKNSVCECFDVSNGLSCLVVEMLPFKMTFKSKQSQNIFIMLANVAYPPSLNTPPSSLSPTPTQNKTNKQTRSQGYDYRSVSLMSVIMQNYKDL